MITDKIKELEATKAKVASLEESIASQLDKVLSELHTKYGFESAQAFIKAVAAATGVRKKKRGGKAAQSEGGKRRKRAKITDETRAEMKRVLADIQSGRFARDWMLENKVNQSSFKATRRRNDEHQIEKVGEKLRAMMPWISKGKMVDRARN